MHGSMAWCCHECMGVGLPMQVALMLAACLARQGNNDSKEGQGGRDNMLRKLYRLMWMVDYTKG